MNNKLEVLSHETFGQVRYVQEGDTFLFCGADVATALGYTNSRKALFDHCKGVTKRYTLTNGGKQALSFISEGDVYRLIAHSKLPAAVEFEHWLFDKVLIDIRKYGGYMGDELLQAAMRDPSVLFKFAEALLQERQRNEILTAENEVLGAKAVYFDAFVRLDSSTNIRTTAKELGVPERFFCRFLQGEGYMFRCPAGNLMPYNKPKCKGLFVVKDYVNHGHTGSYTLITPSGKLEIREALACLPREKVIAYAGRAAPPV